MIIGRRLKQKRLIWRECIIETIDIFGYCLLQIFTFLIYLFDNTTFFVNYNTINLLFKSRHRNRLRYTASWALFD